MMWKYCFKRVANGLIRVGRLEVVFPDGSEHIFGETSAEPVNIHIRNQSTLRSLCLNPDLALGEAYMNEGLTIENDDLYGLLSLVVRNTSRPTTIASRRVMTWMRTAVRFFSQHNPIGRALSNVRHHYDLSEALYELFLDHDRQYSCAYFADAADTLEQAQSNKKSHIARKLLIESSHSVLDIGSGWGGMGLTLAKKFGCQVQGVTLSTGQHNVSNRRAREEGLSDQVKFSLMDYRNLNAKFDRIVSVGMFEHVGAPHYREFFRCLHKLLKDDGIALIHTIGRSTPPGSTNPWISKHIFPGGYIPAMSEVLAAIERENLMVTDIEILRLHYAETLKHWHDRFMANIERVRDMYDDRFCRMWRYYLVASEMAFRHAGQVVFQFQIAKKVDSVPLTRDYIYPSA